MRILFLDDSFDQANGYLAYGGVAVSGEKVRDIHDAINAVKSDHGVPLAVELKWSPPPNHFLRAKKLKGSRHDLYKDVLGVLSQFDARVLCAVHSLNDTYGVKLHGWSSEDASIWAAKQQLKFLAERFETNDLERYDDQGLIISDRYGSRAGEADLIRNFSFDMIMGTEYNQLKRIQLPPLMADSKHTNLIQAADLVTGIIVATLRDSQYGVQLFEDVARLFVFNPHHGSVAFASTFSFAVLRYGLKLFPTGFRPKGLAHFKPLDEKFVVTKEGIMLNARTRVTAA
jgi:hypothetical protein